MRHGKRAAHSLCADIIKTYADLIGLQHLPRRFQKRVQNWTMSQPLINGFFGVEIDLADRPNSNYFSIPDWSAAASYRSTADFGRTVPGGSGYESGEAWAREMAQRQQMFVQSSSRRDPSNHRAAPSGHATIEVQTITPANPRLWGFDGYNVAAGDYSQDQRYRDIKKIMVDGTLERMEQAFPGSSSKVKLSELGSPATQTRFVNNTGAPRSGSRPGCRRRGRGGRPTPHRYPVSSPSAPVPRGVPARSDR